MTGKRGTDKSALASVVDRTTLVQRDVLANGTTRLAAGACEFLYRRLRPGVLLITISGEDRGQFGSSTLDEVASESTRFGQKLSLFFDLRETKGPTTPVMEMWTAWFANHQDSLHRVVLLVPPESRVLHLSVSIAQHLSRTGNLIRICGDAAEFKQTIVHEVPGFDVASLD